MLRPLRLRAADAEPGRSGTGFRYDSALRPLLWVVIALGIVEGATVELVLALALPGSTWVWVSLGLHCYAVFGLLAVLGSFATRPHLLENSVLRLRDGVFAEVVVPYSAIRDVTAAREPNVGRSGLKTRGDVALLAHGDANVRITFHEPMPLGRTQGELTVTVLAVSADDAGGFIKALNARLRTAPERPSASEGVV